MCVCRCVYLTFFLPMQQPVRQCSFNQCIAFPVCPVIRSYRKKSGSKQNSAAVCQTVGSDFSWNSKLFSGVLIKCKGAILCASKKCQCCVKCGVFGVGENHKHTMYIRFVWQRLHQIYGHIQRTYTVFLVKASSNIRSYTAYIYGLFGKGFIKYTVIYGVHIRSRPTLQFSFYW